MKNKILFILGLILLSLFAVACTTTEGSDGEKITGNFLRSRSSSVTNTVMSKIECNTFLIDPSFYLGKTGEIVCQTIKYSTCVAMYDQKVINGGADTLEHVKGCIGDHVVENTLTNTNNIQTGHYTSSVSCCRLS